MVPDVDNMRLVFDTCNMEYFEGKLLFPQFEVMHSFRKCGFFKFTTGGWSDKTMYDPVIMMTDYFDLTESQYVNVMCHEMIHYYLAYYSIDTNCKHGREFMEKAKQLNEMYGLNIQVKTDMSTLKLRKGAPLLGCWLSKFFL